MEKVEDFLVVSLDESSAFATFETKPQAWRWQLANRMRAFTKVLPIGQALPNQPQERITE